MNQNSTYVITVIIFMIVILLLEIEKSDLQDEYNRFCQNLTEKSDPQDGYNRFCQNLTGNQNAAWKMVWTQCEEQKIVWYYDCCSNEEQACLYKSTSREEC